MARIKKALIDDTNKMGTIVEKETITEFRHSLWATERDLKELAHSLVEYVRNTPDCYSIEYYLNTKNIHNQKFYEWVEKNSDLREAVEMSKQIIFERREKGAITGKLSHNSIMPYMHHYSPRYKEHAIFMAGLNKKEDEKPTQITVVMEPFAKIEDKKDVD